MTATEAAIDPGILHAIAEADAPRHGEQTPGQWVKSNLFNNWYNSIITVIFTVIAAWAGYKLLRFGFVTARWEPVRVNLELFMIGTYPREERMRIVVQLLAVAGAGGLLAGWSRQRAIDVAEQTGVPREITTVRERVGVYGAVALFFFVALAIGARTLNPWLLALGCIVGFTAAFVATMHRGHPAGWLAVAVPFAIAGVTLSSVPDLNNQASYLIALGAAALLAIVRIAKRNEVTLSAGLVVAVAAFQVTSGTGGIAWVFLGAALLPVVPLLDEIFDRRVPATNSAAFGWINVAVLGALAAWRFAADGVAVVPLALAVMTLVAAVGVPSGGGAQSRRLLLAAVAGIVAWSAAKAVGLSGIDWSDWEGLHLNLVVAGASVVLAFPIGLLLALGRRSTLPVLRWMCTTYIELIRGVPLISLLLMGQFFIGFFLNSDTPLSSVTRATAAITMFSAAYIAEIVRGGLQSVAKGQTEAGQALGLSAAKITRLLVLPQALRAVIPSMVGQFISLFKDTTLLTIIGITEFLGVREIVHSQEAFRGFGIAETLVFVAFGFWAFSFTMSRESQRLERRLGVGFR
jgi:general L-amino acid transport system permease protein